MAFLFGAYPLLTAAAVTGPKIEWRGGRGVVWAIGTFGGGTVRLEWTPDDGVTWIPVDRSGDTFATFTAAGSGLFELPICSIRAAVIGGSGASITAGANGL